MTVPSSTTEFRPGTVIGDFRLKEKLGEGGMATVYAARQLSLDRDVALKVLPAGLGLTSAAVRRFRREAQAAARFAGVWSRRKTSPCFSKA